MRLIDLLNRIANCEKVPAVIKWYENILYFNYVDHNYYFDDKDEIYTNKFILPWIPNSNITEELNTEIKILEW